jgi:hypothetical protein
MIGLAMVVILTAMLPSSAAAQQLGDFCWTLNPFVDTIRLSITQAGGQILQLNGRWLAKGGNAAGGAGGTYQLLGSGTATVSVTLPNSFEAGFQAAHNTTFFGGNQGCNLFAVIDNLTLNGSWTLQCPGPTPFRAQGTLTFVSTCPGNF